MTSLSLVRYRSNDYSVPVAWGHREVLVKGFVEEVVICAASEVIARHVRSYEQGRDDLRSVALSGAAGAEAERVEPGRPPGRLGVAGRLRATAAADGGAVRQEGASGSMCRSCDCWRRSVGPEVSLAVEDALRLGAISSDAVKHLLLGRIEQRPARLDLEHYPHLPATQVATTAAADYLTLLREGVC